MSDRITWLGHATTLIEAAGTRLLTDPLLGARLLHLRRHGPSPAVPKRIDAVLLSHLHHDHADATSLRALPRGTPVVVPRGAGAVVGRLVRGEVTELAPGEHLRIGGATVEAVPAVHDGGRGPLLGRGAQAIGYVIAGDARTYFAGDTEVFDGMRAIGDDRLDAALLPVWGWGPSLGDGHMDPEQAAQAAALLRPGLAVPIHWGTFLPVGLASRRPGLLTSPGPAFAEATARAAPGVEVAVLRPGGFVVVS